MKAASAFLWYLPQTNIPSATAPIAANNAIKSFMALLSSPRWVRRGRPPAVTHEVGDEQREREADQAENEKVPAWSKTAASKASETTAKLAETAAGAADEVAATAHKAARAAPNVAADRASSE